MQVNSPFHTVIPVNCRKITRMTLPVNSKMHCSHRQRRSVFFLVKHHSHIHFKIQVNSVTSLIRNESHLGVVFVNMKGYTWAVFLLMFIIVDDFKPNYTAQSKCVIYVRNLIGPEALNFSFQRLWIGPE